ncbi:MAG: copper chaperone PCu(A)C [Pseudoxanthomonas sp.]|nr:copper chaperone PCu(A)C [Pseudoxanthomonas sp.]
MHIRSTLFTALLLLPGLAFAAAPTPADAGCLAVRDGWIRLSPVPRPTMLAGFGRIINGCVTAQAVVAVRSPRFGDVSLHETQVVDGVSRMREVERLPLTPGGEAVLAPGGLHLMLMQPDAVLADGERVPLVLVLADGHQVAAELQVRRTAPEPAHAH